MSKLTVSFYSLLFISSIGIASAQVEQINLKYIQEFIKRPTIQNVDDFIRELPQNLKKNPEHMALAHTPNGLISADYDFPNVYLKGDKNSSLVIVYNSNPSNNTKKESVEILSYEVVNGQPTHQLAEIVFAPDSTPKIEINPTSCIQCHGSPARPLWVSGYNWDGFISFEQDRYHSKFIIENNKYKNNPRLSFINFEKYLKTNPLISMSSRLAAEHSTIIATQILRHKNYPELKKELFQAMSLCDEPILKKNVKLEEVLRKFDIMPEQWYMNRDLENDPSQRPEWAMHPSNGQLLGFNTKRTAFETGLGPIEFFVLSHLIQNDSALDLKIIKKIYSKSLQNLPKYRSHAYPEKLYQPNQLDLVGGEFGSQPSTKWCEKFERIFPD